MAVCPTCKRWLVSHDLVVADGALPDASRDRCPYDGARVDMNAPVPADGGPLLGLKPTPPPKTPLLENLQGMLGVAGCLFVAVGVWLVGPLFVVAAIVTAATGSTVLLAAWLIFAVILGGLAFIMREGGPDRK